MCLRCRVEHRFLEQSIAVCIGLLGESAQVVHRQVNSTFPIEDFYDLHLILFRCEILNVSTLLGKRFHRIRKFVWLPDSKMDTSDFSTNILGILYSNSVVKYAEFDDFSILICLESTTWLRRKVLRLRWPISRMHCMRRRQTIVSDPRTASTWGCFRKLVCSTFDGSGIMTI